jgi:hypothetical protein
MANTYGMLGGAGADSTYSGSYNITPTTSDITLATKNTGLEGDMTIQGDSDLVAGNINYGKSVFGVDGSYLALNMGQGEGTAYVSGVVSEGDVIRSVSDKATTGWSGLMPEVSNLYQYYTRNDKTERLLSQCGNKYITISTSNSNVSQYEWAPTFRVYNNQTLVSTINLTNIFGGDTSLAYTTANIKTGDIFMKWGVYSGGSGFNRGILKININDGTYKYIDSLSILGRLTICYDWLLQEDCVVYLRDVNRVDILDMNLNYIHNSPISLKKSLNILQYSTYRFILGRNSLIYGYSSGIQGSNISGNYDDFVEISMSGSVYYNKSLKQSDFNFNSGTKLPNGYCAILACQVNAGGQPYLYYSNRKDGSTSEESGKVTCLAMFDGSMSSKIGDVPMAYQTSVIMEGLGNEELTSGFYYNTLSDTMIIYSKFGYIKSEGTVSGVFAYCTTYLSYPSYPSTRNNGAIDYTYTNSSKDSDGYFYATGTYIDGTTTITKTITTDTYTAELEEV